MQGQGHPLGVDGAQDLGCCGPQQWLPIVQCVVRQFCRVLWSWHSLHFYHLLEKERQGVARTSWTGPADSLTIRRLSLTRALRPAVPE